MNMLMFEPDRYFPSCHASCLLPRPDGRYLAAYFAGAHEKAGDVGIWLSEYDGTAWQAPRLIAKLSDEPHWNPVLFDVAGGIRIVFKVGWEIAHWRSMTMLSRDEGRTWSTPHGYPDNLAGGPVRSKPIRLADGALLAPNSDEAGHWTPRVDISRDEGETFERLADIPVNLTDAGASDYISGRGAIQPTLWQDADGLHALLRTSAGYIYASDSRDGGRTWTRARRTDLPNNNSGIDVTRADDGRLFLALNPVSGDFVARTPLCVYMSDDGREFRPFAVLEDVPTDPATGAPAEFSYPSLIAYDGQLCASYTFNRRAIAFWSCKL
ncbi:MAG TPA: exo-alpha-sialidase [Candidatus Fimadaptatus faecigallinarum]|uniref:Exo-alpha-sialidase n=1 Tax=Candidatus Fimadaptatus faecigallinarum TaxID=2840814 RepID=A0A9D1S4A6_9FIRM|nr:exo-alpha-sialidase [Candidatus Fimadaptatus faecigallinarum]